MKQPYESDFILDILDNFIKSHKSNEFTMADLIHTLGERSFGLVLLLMALPNALLIASIPGLSSIFGSIMALTSLQMMLGFRDIWLPENIKNKAYAKSQLEKIVETSTPFMAYISRFIKPRFLILTTDLLKPLLGLISFINSIWIALPIPLGNFFPGIAMVALSLGVITRDGIFVTLGIMLSFLVWLTLVLIYGYAFISAMDFFR